jgi:hypothetical protein
LDRELTELRGRRSELLISRTPLHPAVQDLDDRIQRIQQQLATVPREMPGPTPAARQLANPAGVGEASAAPVPDPAELAALQRAVEEAGRVRVEAVRVERLAWQSRLAEPKVDLQLAVEPPPPSLALPFSPMALLGGVATGLTMVLGLGMIAAGAAIEPPLMTTAQLEAALALPVVGIVPACSGSLAATPRAHRQGLLRWALVLCGVLALAGCLAMLRFVHPA